MKKLILSLAAMTAFLCASDRNVVVAPQFSSSTLGFSMTADEQVTIRNRMIGRLAEIIPADAEVMTAIPEKDSSDYRGVSVKILRYFTEKGKIGKLIGTVTLEVSVFEKGFNRVPKETIVVTEKGQANWGNNTPFESSVDAAVEEVLNQFRRNQKK